MVAFSGESCGGIAAGRTSADDENLGMLSERGRGSVRKAGERERHTAGRSAEGMAGGRMEKESVWETGRERGPLLSGVERWGEEERASAEKHRRQQTRFGENGRG